MSDLNDFLEASGKLEEITDLDKKIIYFDNELNCLESESLEFKQIISELEVKINEFNGDNSKNSRKDLADLGVEKEKMSIKLNKINKNIDEKTISKDALRTKKDELVKKSLMILHTTLKKEYHKADEEHARYVELYTKERAKKHEIESKMMNLKLIVYKNYGLRLI